ncbi:CPBP family intramembrane glutamic endopeptidase [Romboutsia lituseburensis]|uniref:CAAX prenyl protease 2/Lysostaphin resistance protein A-like domain-containing protein n=2 Tax=root TaxID=1 RepID=A0A1G9JHM3_9FIRM|nr:type II CAAX endopeptidase family protein [Romboutsia lituseburensis]CEH33493.1 Membrane spanning protein [Romboutsia lituseburensis]SDL36782.1 hypothetical protein SAMN04515677_101648 [Romboutsia lituseburensis DSM 797]
MSTDIKDIKQEIKYFLLVNFGLIAFISIFLFISSSKPEGSVFITNFGGVFMYIPAFSVIVVLKKVSNYEFNPKVEKFFKFFAIATIVRIIVAILDVLVFKNIITSSVVDACVSLYLLGVVLFNASEFESINLSLNKNLKKVLIVVAIFLAILITKIVITAILDESSTINLKGAILTVIMSLVMNFFLGFNLFFGEEFGWRYFLQPRLQKLYGKKSGVLILGFIWGIWHLPLCFTLYSPKTPIFCVILHVTYCMLLGVFLGYAYMKTENIWCPILIHLANNSIIVILAGGYESVITPGDLLMNIVLNGIFFLPFLFAKEYKSKAIEEQSNLDL